MNLLELSVRGNFTSIILNSDSHHQYGEFDEMLKPYLEPKLLFESTLSFTQPRKSDFRDETESM